MLDVLTCLAGLAWTDIVNLRLRRRDEMQLDEVTHKNQSFAKDEDDARRIG